LYRKWKNGEDVSGYFRPFYEQFRGKPIMIRSSAVYSEDGETMTGAGIYDSVSLEENATFEDFMKAVYQVYKSCDNDGALAYREENGVTDEVMGLVVQEKVQYPELGYVNSTRPGTDDLIYVKMDNEDAPYILYSKIFDDMALANRFGSDTFQSASRIQHDLYKHREFPKIVEGLGVILFARILERHYGMPVQVEFALYDDYSGPLNIYFLQARPLPAKMFDSPKTEFPKDQQHIFECDSEGVCDQELDVLYAYQDNSQETGLVAMSHSHMMSFERNRIRRNLPKNGACIVYSASEPGNGHIETLALEKGLTLLFNERFSEPRDEESEIVRSTRNKIAQDLQDHRFMDFAGHKKVRVVSDGRKARVYPAKK